MKSKEEILNKVSVENGYLDFEQATCEPYGVGYSIVSDILDEYTAQYKADNDRLREALQNIIDSTNGNNPNEAVFYFTTLNALNNTTAP